jgi:hypothetical protein
VKPQSRRRGLLIRELPDEVLVYDREQHRAHCLNRTAAVIFRHADGTRSLAELARLLAPETSEAAVEGVVTLALARLAEADLLEGPATAVPPAAGLTRRQVARRVGIAAAVLLPAVATIVAPTPAEAGASCVTDCTGQSTGTPCCDGMTCVCTCPTTTCACVAETCSP